VAQSKPSNAPLSAAGFNEKPLIDAQFAESDTTNPTAIEEDALATATAQHWEAMIAQIEALVKIATSLPELQTNLTNSFGGLPTDELVRVMAAGFALAELKGMVDVSDGS
jgi:hypothetical protein